MLPVWPSATSGRHPTQRWSPRHESVLDSVQWFDLDRKEVPQRTLTLLDMTGMGLSIARIIRYQLPDIGMLSPADIASAPLEVPVWLQFR